MTIFGKKYTAGKLAGLIFFIAAAIMAVALTFAGTYFGGQMKTVDKWLTSFERGDYKAYAACVPTRTAKKISESGFKDAAKSEMDGLAQGLPIPADPKVKAAFKGRVKLDSGRYAVTCKLTVYNESGDYSFIETYTLSREGNRWVIESSGSNL